MSTNAGACEHMCIGTSTSLWFIEGNGGHTGVSVDKQAQAWGQVNEQGDV